MRDIHFEEWLKMLEDIKEKNNENAFTVRELCEYTGRSDKWVRDRIREGFKAGMVKLTYKKGIDMCGRALSVPAYIFLKRRVVRGGKKNEKR